MLHTLRKHPHRTFIWAEISYFKKWYDAKSASDRAAVKALVQQGRFEFVNGGWVMHDEAVSSYRDDILQLVVGRAWLLRELGVTPQTAWLIDPFGHSPTTPVLYSGVKGAVINRIYYREKDARRERQDLEFYWTPKLSHPSAKGKAKEAYDVTGIDDTKTFVHTLAKG